MKTDHRGKGLVRWITGMYAVGLGILAMAGGHISDAKWIGTSGYDLPLRADQLSVFLIDFKAEMAPGSEVSLLYGMNDPRLRDDFRNLMGVEDRDENAAVIMKICADGKVRIYRRGFSKDDREDTMLAEFDVSSILKMGVNDIRLMSNYGHADVYVNGIKAGYAGTGPVSNGGDFQTYPVMGDMRLEISDKAQVYDFKARNFREPQNVLFSVRDTMYANAPINIPAIGMPEMRTEIRADQKKMIKKVSADVTARGIYDMTVNGERVSNGYFYPGSTQYNKTHLYNSFDLTPFFRKGTNDIRVQLGEGWWSGPSTSSVRTGTSLATVSLCWP